MNYVIIGNIFGIIGLIVSAIAYHKRQKKKILLDLIISNSFSLVQYLFLQAYTGCITIIISILRNIIAIKKGEKNKNLVLIIFIILYIVMGILTYNSIFSILLIIASIIYLLGIWDGREDIIRKTGLINMYLWLIYSISIWAVAGVIQNIILIISTHIAIRNNRRKNARKNNK